MAKIIYNKDDSKATNKHIVQDIIYNWANQKYSRIGNQIIMLAGMNPFAAIKRALKLTSYNLKIYLYENNNKVYRYLTRQKIIEKISEELRYYRAAKQVELKFGNVNDAPHFIKFQDLDFCSTWCQNRKRSKSREYIPSDIINILHNRLHYLKQIDKHHDKVLIGTISTRNGIGKRHTIECLNDLCYQLGWSITFVDGYKRGWYDGYGVGSVIEGSGHIHGNGYKYYAYEHKIITKPLKQFTKPVEKFSIRFFTYTDTQPMLTFAIGFR